MGRALIKCTQLYITVTSNCARTVTHETQRQQHVVVFLLPLYLHLLSRHQGQGEHSDQVLAELGYAPDEIAALRADGVI